MDVQFASAEQDEGQVPLFWWPFMISKSNVCWGEEHD